MSDPAQKDPPAAAPPAESPEERKKRLDAEDRELTRRCLAGDAAETRKMLWRLNGLLERWCLKDTPDLYEHFEEIRGDCWELFARWLVEKKVPEEQPVPYLARALWKQAAEAYSRRLGRERREVPLVQPLPTGEMGTPHWMERELAQSAGHGNPEEAVATHEAAVWLRDVREKLSPTERETYDAEVAVSDGEAASLHEALGIDEEAAWKRRQRLRKTLKALAAEAGAVEILERAQGARSVRRDKGPVSGRRKWLT